MRRVLNAWTTMKVAQNIKKRSKTNGGPSPNNATRQMAVTLRRVMTHNAPRNPGRQLFRGVKINKIENLTTRENAPTSWTTNKRIAKHYAGPSGIVLALALNNKTPFIEIKRNKKVRWSGFKEHLLPPGNITVGLKNNNVHRVTFVPNVRYLTPWTFY